MDSGASTFKDILKSTSYMPLTAADASSPLLDSVIASDNGGEGIVIDSDVATFDRRVEAIVDQLKAVASDCIIETKQKAVRERDELVSLEREATSAAQAEMQLKIEALSVRVHELEEATRRREAHNESLRDGMLLLAENNIRRKCKQSVFGFWKLLHKTSSQKEKFSTDLCDVMYNKRLKFRAFASLLNSSKANKVNDMILKINEINSEKMKQIQSEHLKTEQSLQLKIDELSLELKTERSMRQLVEEKQAKIISTLNFLNVEATSISAAYPPAHPSKRNSASSKDALNTTVGSDEGPRDTQFVPRPLPVTVTPVKAAAAGAKKPSTPRGPPAKGAAKASPLSTAIFHSPMAGVGSVTGPPTKRANCRPNALNVIVTKSQ